MKYILALLLTISTAQAVDWDTHPYDKMAHMAVGIPVSCLVTNYTKNPWYGILASTALGVVKESTDKHFDNGDLASWMVGGLVGSICFQF